jgi:peptide/nickel transport system substrate-binding protein
MNSPFRKGEHVSRKRWLSGIASVAILALVAAACSSNSTSSSGSSSGEPTAGGTYRTATQTLSNTSNFDPTGEYYGYAWAMFQNLLIRGLYNYNHVPDEAGNVPQPDLVTDAQISDDGLTYAFTIRDNVMWAPPVDRAVTAADIEYAFERINNANLAAYYGNYYCGVIKGMTCDLTETKPVSGIDVVDDTHITFHLESATGDFLYRLAMPAAYPQPKEVSGCFDQAGEYGRYLVSNGAYMYFGADKMDLSGGCKTLKPIAGINPDKGITIVKRSDYDTSTYDPAMFSNYLDGLQIEINSNVDDIFQKIQNGDLDGSFADTPPATVEQEYATNPDLQQYIHSNQGDRTWYITMNLLAPPFDDPHVRKAVEYVVDKAALVKGYGGSLHADPATTVDPPSVLPATADYNPYPSENFAGDPNAAMEEMKQSKYDTNQDGQCDAPECSGFLLLASNTTPWTNMNPILVEDLAKIGLKATLSEVKPDVVNAQAITVKKLVPMTFGQGWGKDFGSPYGFGYFVFNGETISCTGSYDEGLLGMTEDQAKECDVLDEYNAAVQNYPDGKLPSIDAKMADCVALTGDEQQSCYAEMEKTMMEEGMTWVPWGWGKNLIITSPSVTQYVYDQSAGDPAWAHVAVNNGLAPENVA